MVPLWVVAAQLDLVLFASEMYMCALTMHAALNLSTFHHGVLNIEHS